MNKHLTSKTHRDLIERKYRKLNNYNAMKDSFNCCSKCLKTNIDDLYFLKDRQMCSCCDDILRGGVRRCKNCQQLVHINRMERPYLISCKACANERLSKIVKNNVKSVKQNYVVTTWGATFIKTQRVKSFINWDTNK